jgi:mRNA interferase MazF
MAGTIIRRGDFVLAASPGDYGKPRPTLVIQSNLFANLPSIAICPLTSVLRNDAELVRITVEPNAANGLRKVSQIAIDKTGTLALTRFGERIGRADDELMLKVTRALAVFFGIA